MVHTKTKAYRDCSRSLRWVEDISFSLVPETMIEMLKDKTFSYDEFLDKCEMLNQFPTFKNLALMYGEFMILFTYGVWNFLENEFEIKRVIVRKEFFTYKGELLKEGLSIMKDICKGLQVKTIYWTTPKPKAFLRKMPGVVRESNRYIMEVI
jgi:hypothetical protein